GDQPALQSTEPAKDGQIAAFSTMSAAFSPIIIDGALVLPDVSVGMIEASATRRPAMPWTRSCASTTAIGSDPILQVPTGWYVVSAAFLTQSSISSSVVRSAPGATSFT